MSKEWYYENEGNHVGPVAEENLKSLVTQGTLEKTTLVWSDGIAEWTAAEQALPAIFESKQLNVTEAYRASTVSQPALRQEAYSMTPKEILFSFDGRIRRSTFWGYSIGSGLVCMAIFMIPMFIFGEESSASMIGMFVMIIPFIWTSLAIRIKRWHDRGKSGWWIFIGMIPYVGEIWAFIENGCLDGDHGANQYGPDPKQRRF